MLGRFTVFLICFCQLLTCQTRPNVVATLELLQSEISEKEPVLARLGLHILGYDAVEMNLSPDQDDIALIRRGTDGASQSFMIPRISGITSPGLVRVEPGHKWTKLLVLNQWTTNWNIGEHDLTLAWKQPAYHGRSREPFTVGAITPQRLRVVRYDQGRLVKRLESLMRDLRDVTHNPHEERCYRLAIASVRDPVAIPFLRQFPPFDHGMLSALVAIGTPEALDVFIAHWGDVPVGERGELTRWMFQGMFKKWHNETSDPELKKRLKAACHNVPEAGPQRYCP